MKHRRNLRYLNNRQLFQHVARRSMRLETRDAAAVAPLKTSFSAGDFGFLKLGNSHAEPTISDSRVFLPHRSPESSFFISGIPARVGMSQVSSGLPWMSSLRTYFFNPRQVIVCIRRQTRRRVLFALQKIKKGSHSSFARPRWTAQSRIICRSL